eukprot:jgi/Botrbrau1/10736/Bobra.180_2s0006.1
MGYKMEPSPGLATPPSVTEESDDPFGLGFLDSYEETSQPRTTVYAREFPCEVRGSSCLDTSENAPITEVMKVTLSFHESENGTRSLKVELTSETNVFFFYFDDCDEDEFNKRRVEQKLTLDYNQYAAVLTQLFNSCITEPQTHLAILVLEDDGMRARLDFIKNLEYKFVDLLSCHLEKANDDLTRGHVSQRFHHLRNKSIVLQARLEDVFSMVKLKAPSLALQLHRTPVRLPNQAGQEDEPQLLLRQGSRPMSPVARAGSRASGLVPSSLSRGVSNVVMQRPLSRAASNALDLSPESRQWH